MPNKNKTKQSKPTPSYCLLNDDFIDKLADKIIEKLAIKTVSQKKLVDISDPGKYVGVETISHMGIAKDTKASF